MGFTRRIKEQKIKVFQFEYGPQNIESRFLFKDFYELFEGRRNRVGKIYTTWVDWSKFEIGKENFILSNVYFII